MKGPNRLYYGDCLTIMRDHMKSASVDLIYLDPPFNSNREYNAIYKDETGRPLPDQIEAFCDLWTLDEERERALRNMPILMRHSGIDDAIIDFWQLWTNALRKTQPRLLAYLAYMVERLLQMKSILKPTGSIYLHCDPTASHYIKIMMDNIFGHGNFRNEITWRRTITRKGNLTRGLAADSDTIFRYSKGNKFTWNPEAVIIPYDLDNLDEKTKEKYSKKDEDGRLYSLTSINAPVQDQNSKCTYEIMGITRTWRWSKERMEKEIAAGRVIQTKPGNVPRQVRYLDEQKGKTLNNIWTDIPAINSQAKERMGYKTQKPLVLLERIVKMSSKPGDVVFDPFCGCATTMEAAHQLGRRWIGIDIAIHAIKRVARVRLQDRLGLVDGQDFIVEGVPRNLEGAKDLWERDKYHFQKWAVEQVDGFVTTKKTADGGIDGRLYFSMPGTDDLRSMAIEVKGGKSVSIKDMRALRGVLNDDLIPMAGLIIMEPLGEIQQRNFDKVIADAGDLVADGVNYSRMQILTVEEILGGRRFHPFRFPSPWRWKPRAGADEKDAGFRLSPERRTEGSEQRARGR